MSEYTCSITDMNVSYYVQCFSALVNFNPLNTVTIVIYIYSRHDDRKFNVTIYITMFTVFRGLKLIYIYIYIYIYACSRQVSVLSARS